MKGFPLGKIFWTFCIRDECKLATNLLTIFISVCCCCLVLVLQYLFFFSLYPKGNPKNKETKAPKGATKQERENLLNKKQIKPATWGYSK